MAANRFLKIGIPAVVILGVVVSGFAWRHFKTGNGLKAWTYKIVNTFPHDRSAFTQGLVFENGVLYEGTGIEGHSELRKVELETGNVLQRVKLPDQYFGEGITIFKDRIIQLTYQSKVGFVYDKDSFELLREFTYPTEGWGITHNGAQLIMSDGTPMLYFLDPETLKQINRMMVLDQDRPVWGLNELEYVNGEIYANVWPTNRVVRIAPESGKVIGWIDMEGILPPEDRSEEIDVFNGIAYDPDNHRLFMTGKYWPKLFEIKLIPTK
ncbi:MAG: glutaminyl-peptide cyclotransferase [Sedimentisphaerales bacterium]|nr:glutaminyl-peptide cyclotransferase [Sedimentisphaerales bacterium]